MKVLFINIAFEGHHLDYLRSLCTINEIDSHVILQKRIPNLNCKQYVIPDLQFGTNKILEHLKWCLRVKKIAKEVNPDVIHLVWGDSFYRFFGIGFFWIKKYRSIITFHQIRKSKLHQMSIKIFSKIFSTVVVHTESLYEELLANNIKNVCEITYPNFRNLKCIPQSIAQEYLGIKTKNPVLLSLGGTRFDKGLDILMLALTKVKEPFHLLIAGAEQNIKYKDIKKATNCYAYNTTVILKYLTEEEMQACYCACDYIILPYRKIFDGASGPLAEGTAYGKGIIGPSHGSIGQIIKDNHIGTCFITEDVDSLATSIENILRNGFIYDKKAKEYQDNLKIATFQDRHRRLYANLLTEGGTK